MFSWREVQGACEVTHKQEKKGRMRGMAARRLSFHLIECPMGVSSPHTHLVVGGRGIPHESLTRFYEEIQKRCASGTSHSIMCLLLSFFSFLVQQDQCDRTLDYSTLCNAISIMVASSHHLLTARGDTSGWYHHRCISTLPDVFLLPNQVQTLSGTVNSEITTLP